MKEIKAYVPQERLDRVVQALEAAGAPEVTIVRVGLAGVEVDPEWVDISYMPAVRHNPRLIKLELVCREGEVERYTSAIRSHIGQSSHARITVSTVSLGCDRPE